MWQFRQSTGEVFDAAGALFTTGYAGHGPGLNSPAMQEVHGIGPLPRGKYHIGPLLSSHTVGNKVLVWCAKLTPDPSNEMFGRDGFLIHGRALPGDTDSSEGCIVIDHDPRLKMLQSADKDLEVVE